MNCLPIVDRELRVAARKRSTFWLRIAAAVTVLVIGAAVFTLSLLQRASPAQIGSSLFHVVTWLCLVAGLSAGLFFTSDCLSEEKRDGTLGLLFLTDLRGYDVALGKLLATSLRGFYALLAVLPILAIAMVMGGTSGAQFGKSALALVNALFLSLAAGLAVSALSRDSLRALSGTLCLLLLLVFGGPLADTIIAWVRQTTSKPLWTLTSPGYVLVAASAWGRPPYWSALLITHLLGWLLLALACVLVPRTWQDKKKAGGGHRSAWGYAWRYGGARRRRRLRHKLLDREPVAWLVCRERWQPQGLWIITLLLAGGFVAMWVAELPRQMWFIWHGIGGLFIFVLYLWAASQSCRFHVAARGSGLLELVLASPLNERRIVSGQWLALLRMFGLPVLLLLGTHLVGVTLWQLEFQRMATTASKVTTSVVTNQTGTVSSKRVIVGTTVTTSSSAGTNAAPVPPVFQTLTKDWQRTAMAVTVALASGISTAANLLALCWFGLWMGLTSKTANLATLKTILFVEIIPFLVITFGASMAVGFMIPLLMMRGRSGPSTAWIAWWPLVNTLLAALLAVGKDAGFIVWSRHKLYSSFRERATRSLGQPRVKRLPPALATIPPPPVIAAPQ